MTISEAIKEIKKDPSFIATDSNFHELKLEKNGSFTEIYSGRTGISERDVLQIFSRTDISLYKIED